MSFVSLIMNLIFVIGLILITISLSKVYYTQPKTKRPFIIINQHPKHNYDYLFNDPKPWTSDIDVTRKIDDIIRNPNRYGISQ